MVMYNLNIQQVTRVATRSHDTCVHIYIFGIFDTIIWTNMFVISYLAHDFCELLSELLLNKY